MSSRRSSAAVAGSFRMPKSSMMRKGTAASLVIRSRRVPAGEEAVGAAGEFVLEEEGEEVGVGAAIGLRLDEPCLEARGDAAEPEVAERVEEFRELHRHRLLRVGRDPGGDRGRG